MKKPKNRKKIFLVTALALLAAMLLTVAGVVTYAYFSTLPRVFTDDNTSEIARIGMRINLLFEKLRSGESTNFSGTITYPDGKEVTFDPEAEWGTPENPYIISMSRHMINLYVLQRSGYFDDRYVSQNYDGNGDYIPDSSVKPYFLVCDPETGGPVAVDGVRPSTGENIEIQPIGNDQYPFIGCVGGAPAEGTCTAPNGKTSISSIISNFTVTVRDDEPDVGLFGKIGYLGDEHQTANVNGEEVFNGSISGINDLLLYDVQIVSHPATLAERVADHLWAGDASPNVRYEEDHHIGILAGHIEYASIYNISVYYSDSDTTAIDVTSSGANYHTDSGIIGLVYNLNPSITGNSIGSASGTTIAGQTEGVGNEWGASIDMRTMWNLLNNFQDRNTNTNYASQYYVSSKTVIVDEGNLDANGRPTVTEQSQTQGNLTDRQGTRYTYKHEDFGSVTVSSSINDLITPVADNSDLDTCSVIKITYHAETEDAFFLSQNDTYLNISSDGSAVTTAATDGENTKWRVTSGGKIRTEILGEWYYLNRNGTSGLSIGTSEASATTWSFTEGEGDEYDSLLSTTVNSTDYYVSYNNGWGLTATGVYYYIADGSGHYLSGTASGVTNAASADASVKWAISSPNGATTTVSAWISGTEYYLTCNGTLGVGTSSFTWNRENGVLYTTIQGIRHDLVYDNGWKVVPASGVKITDGSGHYLNATTAAVSNAAEADAAVWQFSAASGDTQIYTVLNGQKYYLTYNNGLTVSTTAATWHRSGDSFYYQTAGQNQKDYYLTYDGSGWTAVGIRYYTIDDGGSNYLRVTGNNTFDNGTAQNATHFYFSNENGANSSGTVYCYVNGQQLYLRNNNGALQTSNAANATSWTNNGTGRITANGTTYSIGYENGAWGLIDTSAYYLIYDNAGHYLNYGSGNNNAPGTGTSANATHWTYNNNRISTVVNGTTYYLRINFTDGGCGGTDRYELQVSTTNSNNVWTRTGDNLTCTVNNSTRYLTYNNNAWAVPNTASTVNFVQQNKNPHAEVTEGQDTPDSIVSSVFASPATAVDFSGPHENKATFEVTEAQTFTREQTTEPVGETYVPLAWEVNTDDQGNALDPPFTVHPKNTGYMMSGTVDNRTGNQYGYGDIRVSGYAKNDNIGNSLTNNQLDDTKIRTYMGGSLRTISQYGASNLIKYASSKEQFQATLDLDNTNVYGLHFMDAPISKTNTVTIPKAVINEQTYYDYPMPKDCIDFRLRTRGYINFFAGTYYTQNNGNNTFFSLHHILPRGENHALTDIKEIRLIYGDSTDAKKPYIYQYSDGTYSEGSAAPTGNYEIVFNMDWVTNPNITWSQRYIYYYEIPVNAGEYALGSVTGKNGAYLMYLDIGTSAATMSSVLGTIDFVYDNNDDKIVVVPDVDTEDPIETTPDYYVPSQTIIYTKNADDDNAAVIDNFTVNVQRTVTNTAGATPTITVVFDGEDDTHLAVYTKPGGDENDVTPSP